MDWMSASAGLIVGLLAGLGLTAALMWRSYRRRLELERRTRESERLAELGSLTGGLAHEIKNPLSTIQLNLQLLEEDLAREPGQERLLPRLRRVRLESSRLRETLDDFLRYAGRLEVEAEPVELNEIVESIADFFAPQAASMGVRLRTSLAPAPVRARVDPKLVRQALLNLVLNGAQAMLGRDNSELLLAVRADEGWARIDVTDTGPGIEPDKQHDIFRAYYSTKRGGTGLGLPMTRRIAEAHGGGVDLTSEPGKGSIFSLRLPRLRD